MVQKQSVRVSYSNWNQLTFAMLAVDPPPAKMTYNVCTPDAPVTGAVTFCQVCQPPVTGRVAVAMGVPTLLSR